MSPRRLALTILVCGFAATPAIAGLDLGPEELVQAAGLDLAVPGYSVPSLVDWNADGLPDLLVGEGGGGVPEARVRVYLNEGSPGAPQFASFSYVQAAGGDLVVAAGGCLGCFPRAVQWDGDGRKDLVLGTYDGRVLLYLNTGTDAAPIFDAGQPVLVGPPEHPVAVDVGDRATPTVVDWNDDGRKDLVVGAYDGAIHLFLNGGADAEPVFETATLASTGDEVLTVPGGRSSPVVRDLDDDGRPDLLSGNTEGQLVQYLNTGTASEPVFGAGYTLVAAAGVPVDLPGAPRSRPCACDWTGDGHLDLLVGAGDGLVHLFQGGWPTAVPGAPPPAPVARLLPPWPNPVNPRTTLAVDLARPAHIHLDVFDLQGHRVATVIDGDLAAGRHAVAWDGGGAPSGTYLARLGGDVRPSARKILVVR